MLQLHIKENNLPLKHNIWKLIGTFVTSQDRRLVFSSELIADELKNTMF